MHLEWSLIEQVFPGLPGTGRWLPLLDRHAALVEAANERVNLTTITGQEMVVRHYGESLALVCSILAVEPDPSSIVDIGSGAGYPGLVAACLLPATRHVLIEPRGKRAAILTAMCADLGLGNVEVRAERAEEAGRSGLRGRASVVTARAVAPLPVLLEYAAPLAAPGGLLAFLKGSRLPGELAASGAALDELGTALLAAAPLPPELGSPTRTVLFRQERSVPDRYPRRAGLPERHPLGGGAAKPQSSE